MYWECFLKFQRFLHVSLKLIQTGGEGVPQSLVVTRYLIVGMVIKIAEKKVILIFKRYVIK